MAKNTATVPDIIKDIKTKLDLLATVATGKKAATPVAEEEETETEAETEESASVEIPSVKELKALEKKEVFALCDRLSIEYKGKKSDEMRAVLIIASKVSAGTDITPDESKKLAEALGLEVSKKHEKNLANIKDYLSVGEETADDADSEGDESSETDDDAETEESDEEESEEETDDAEESEGDEEAAKPAKKTGKKPKPAAAEEEESEEETSEEETEEETEEESEEESDDESEEESEEETEEEGEESEVSAADQKKRLAAYNGKAKKKLKDYDALVERLTDDEGNVAEWGEPYIKSENYYCCGLPLADVKHKGKEAGKCQITGSVFVVKDDEIKKVA